VCGASPLANGLIGLCIYLKLTVKILAKRANDSQDKKPKKKAFRVALLM
jgi:hypothetical protein